MTHTPRAPRASFAVLLCCAAALLPAAGVRADFSFVHVTDTHVGATAADGSNAQKDAALFREIRALTPAPAFVIHTGDVVEVGTPAEYGVYQKALGDLRLPLYAAPGNHDVRWNPTGKEGYTRGAAQPLHQSWDKENVHFVLLDSTVLLQHWGHFDQAMLDWLKQDLQKIGPNRPVVIGFHHGIGGDQAFVDNQKALLDVIAPYNVRLLLIGHGHSDRLWNVNGIPAIMAKGLYQGSYHLIQVTRTEMRVLRRNEQSKAPTLPVATIPLARPAGPGFSAHVEVKDGEGTVAASGRDLPADSALAFRLDSDKPAPMVRNGDGWTGAMGAEGLLPGEHVVTVEATLPDKRVYVLPVPLTLTSPETVAPVWTADLGAAVQSKLVRAGDTLYVSTMGGDVVALDPATGRERWRAKTGGAVFSTPLAANGTVYFGSADHNVWAVDAATGATRWKTETGGAVFAGAAAAQGIVCIGSTDTRIYGLDAATGRVVWTVQGAGMYQSQTATDGERFFVGGWDNDFHALDARTGRQLWKQRFGKNARGAFSFYYAPAIGSPTVGDGRVFVTSNDGMLHAMDAATGKLLWEVGAIRYGDHAAPASPSLGYSGPLLRNGRIYNASLTDRGYVFCFDAATGDRIWDTPTGAVIYDSSCAWGDDKVFVGSVNGVFSALRASDGALAWQYRLGPGHLLASPATDDTRVFIGSMSGKIVALPLAAPAAAIAPTASSAATGQASARLVKRP